MAMARRYRILPPTNAPRQPSGSQASGRQKRSPGHWLPAPTGWRSESKIGEPGSAQSAHDFPSPGRSRRAQAPWGRTRGSSLARQLQRSTPAAGRCCRNHNFGCGPRPVAGPGNRPVSRQRQAACQVRTCTYSTAMALSGSAGRKSIFQYRKAPARRHPRPRRPAWRLY